MLDMAAYLAPALEQARIGCAEGGVPIGAALFAGDRAISTGRNQRVQMSSPTRHAEMDCLENAGRLRGNVYARATMVTTLSPCVMCTGAILLYGIHRVIIGENRNFLGGEDFLRGRGVEVVVLDDADCIDLMERFMVERSDLWNEDVGVNDTV
ncbi:MAG: nucleoside deaminase [Blastococcus sp.]|jgi:creatinine deaminase|nr:nucleoside deaminase [Blastococcus sp.]